MTLTVDTVETIENGAISAFEYYKAVQVAINSGSAWSLQGSYGRLMMEAIEDGYCLLGRERAQDYWGNVIPSRDDVVEGTKGSRSYVAELCDEDWADAMEGV